jgi:hypothetical protein
MEKCEGDVFDLDFGVDRVVVGSEVEIDANDNAGGALIFICEADRRNGLWACAIMDGGGVCAGLCGMD